jgi:tetratricopeptide (TPR) repeat protein
LLVTADPATELDALLIEAGRANDESRWPDAIGLLRAALALDPESIPVRTMLSASLANHPDNEADLRRSLELSRQVLRIIPDFADAHMNAAVASYKLGLEPELHHHFEVAWRLTPEDHPNFIPLRLGQAGFWLEQGLYEQGFPAYEKYTDLFHDRAGKIVVDTPWWRGEPLEGKTILLHAGLDGFGDAMQFIRYAPMVKALGATVLLACHESIAYLLAECIGIDLVIPEGVKASPEHWRHDFHCPLTSLPAVLRTTLETVPAKVPYLAASEAAIAKWKPIIDAIPGFRVGVTWQGRPDHGNDRFRSIPLKAFAPLASIPGVSLVPLQKGFGREQVESCGFPLADLGDAYQAGDWMDTAAVASQLDLIISPDSSIAHLGGALARPTWIALPRPAEWRWLRDREDSPWYPTARLFRQDRIGDWGPVFARMAHELESISRTA